MTFKTEDGVGPPEDWYAAVYLPHLRSVQVMSKTTKIEAEFLVLDVGEGYWLACLINEGLGVGDEDGIEVEA